MPSRKQRRRRAKDRRHDYEYVYVDSEGREVDADELEVDPTPRTNGRAPKAATKGRTAGAKAAPRASAAGGRRVEPPSWRRVLKRALIFAPIMFLTITLLNRDAGTAAHVIITGQMLLMFIPFSYLMDRVLYRRFVKQTGGEAAGVPARRG